MSYYNTTHQTGFSLQTEKRNALSMDDKIHLIFRDQSQKDEHLLTPYRISEILTLAGYNYPITSVRRSINTLTKRNILKKTSTMKTGGYGKPNHCWKLSSWIRWKI